jgi:hypothetical protein
MDVVNGEIVSARTERWSALYPSSASSSGLVNMIQSPPHAHSWGVPSSMAPEPGAARWQRRPRDHNILGHPHKLQALASPAPSPETPGPFLAGWKRSFHGLDHDHDIKRGRHWDSSSVALFEELEMAMYRQPHGCGTATDPASGQELQYLLSECDEGLQIHNSFAKGAKLPDGGMGTVNSAPRRAMELPAGTDQDGVTWIAPLRSLLRKELTVSDVGELGRIVLPKKDAERKLPQIETKGKLLDMGEYSFSKHWFFQYKCWINNKSRMYVLENTGEFVKYHGLKPRDSFTVYEDGCGNLVVRGQKKSDSLCS